MPRDKNKLANDILIHCRKKIQSKFSFFSISLYFLKLEEDEQVEKLATDGYYLYYNSDYVISQYREDKNILYLGIVHILLHCLLRHFSKKQCTYYELYDVVMDIKVYLMLGELKLIKPVAKRQALQSIPRLNYLLQDKLTRSSEYIYNQAINDEQLCKSLLDSSNIFKVDNHVYWTKPKKRKEKRGGESSESLYKMWSSLFSEVSDQLIAARGYDNEMRDFSDLFLSENHKESEVSYEDFLRRFASFKEVFEVDTDSFDLMWYTLGLEMYDDMPIIEFNEIKEDYVVDEFVLAIDTSGSCSGEIMQDFLSQTIKIFKDMELGNRRIKAKIIQCDCRVVDEKDISCSDDIEDYTSNFKAYGFGGTDFNPVFDRINELQENGDLSNLKGLIYLSDGFGEFPSQAPSYETVFVQPNDYWGDPTMPDWIETIVLK